MNHHHHDDAHLEDQGTLSEREKLGKLLEYWIKHNEDHARTYLEWSKKADSQGLKDIVSLLKEASEMSTSINKLFKKAIKTL
jgi:rubrerythrin